MSSSAGEKSPVMVEAGDVVHVGLGPLVVQVRTTPATVKVWARTTIKVLRGAVVVAVGPGEEPLITVSPTGAGHGAILNIKSTNVHGGRCGVKGVNVVPGDAATITITQAGCKITTGYGGTLAVNVNFPGFLRFPEFHPSLTYPQIL